MESAEHLGGEPDHYDRLWTPHRLAYIKDATERGGLTTDSGCPLCRAAEGDDRETLVIARGEHCYAVLNLYPYNPGHIMICPNRHVGLYTDATDAERDEMSAMTQTAMRALATSSGAKGFNIGMNQGVTGGAGIAEHLHQHVVPRWVGDANFLPIIGHTKAMPEMLDDSWQRLSDAWKAETLKEAGDR